MVLLLWFLLLGRVWGCSENLRISPSFSRFSCPSVFMELPSITQTSGSAVENPVKWQLCYDMTAKTWWMVSMVGPWRTFAWNTSLYCIFCSSLLWALINILFRCCMQLWYYGLWSQSLRRLVCCLLCGQQVTSDDFCNRRAQRCMNRADLCLFFNVRFKSCVFLCVF